MEKCQYCTYTGPSAIALRKHRSRKHPEHVIKKEKVSLSRSKTFKKANLNNKHVSKETKMFYRAILNDNELRKIDGLYHSNDIQENDIFKTLMSTLTLVEPKNCYHLICMELDIVKTIPYVQEVLPLSCQCFCNLLEETDNPEKLLEEVLAKPEHWHYHTLVILKEGHNERTVRHHFNAVFGGNQYRLVKINDVNHYVNCYLYILGRESSKKILTHVNHSYGHYLRADQKANLYRLLSPAIPEPSSEKSRKKVLKFKKKQNKYCKNAIAQMYDYDYE